MLFKYTYEQKSGDISYAYVDLTKVVNFKCVKYRGQDWKEGDELAEGFILETKFKVQQPIEVPIEQPRTKEQKVLGERNISHSKWELGWTLLSISVREKEEVEQLKTYLSNNKL